MAKNVEQVGEVIVEDDLKEDLEEVREGRINQWMVEAAETEEVGKYLEATGEEVRSRLLMC